MLFSGTSIRAKFLISPLFITVITVGFLFYFSISIEKHFTQVETFTANEIKLSQSLYRTLAAINYTHHDLFEYSRKDNQRYRDFDVPEYQTELAKNIYKLSFLSEKIFKSKVNKDLADTTLEKLKDYQVYYQNILNLIAKGEKPNKGDLSAFETSYGIFQAYSKNLMNQSGDQMQERVTDFQKQVRSEYKISLGILAISILLSFLGSLFLSQKLVQPISNLANLVHNITKTGRYDLRAPKTEQGEVGSLIDGVNQMLFEIQRADDLYKAELNYHRSALNIVPNIYIMTDTKGLVKFFSRSVSEALGLPKTKIKGQPLSRLLVLDTPSLKEKVNLCLYQNEVSEELDLILKYGKNIILFHATIAPLKDDGKNKTTGYLISGFKKARG